MKCIHVLLTVNNIYSPDESSVFSPKLYTCKFPSVHVASNSVQLHAVNWRGCVTGSPSPMLSLRSNIVFNSTWAAELKFGMVGPWVSVYIRSPGSDNCPAACQPLKMEGRSSREQPLCKTLQLEQVKCAHSHRHPQLWRRHTRITALPNKLITVPTLKPHFPS